MKRMTAVLAVLTTAMGWSGSLLADDAWASHRFFGGGYDGYGTYAWGSGAASQLGSISGSDGSGTETAGSGNCQLQAGMGWTVSGPVRVGIFAKGSSTRWQAGASYWGIMELSGNLSERCVTVCSASGRAFAGSHGNGILNATGGATNTDWSGGGCRGGGWSDAVAVGRVSDRTSANANTWRNHMHGWRGVRTAP